MPWETENGQDVEALARELLELMALEGVKTDFRYRLRVASDQIIKTHIEHAAKALHDSRPRRRRKAR